MKDTINEIAKDFFDKMGIEVEGISTEIQEEDKHIYMIRLNTPDSKLIIGPRGSTLEQIRSLLAQMLANKTEGRPHIHLEVNDYLAQKDEKLFSYIDRKIEFVMESKGKVSFRQFSPYERRKIHAYVSGKNISELTTYSTDEDGVRILNLAFSKPSSIDELDMDGVDI